MGLIGRLKDKGRRLVLSKILALVFTKAAEGDFGEPIKKAYWWLAGKKTAIGLLFGLAWQVLDYGQTSGYCATQGWDCTGWASGLAVAAGFMVTWGLYDGAIRTKAPNKFAGLLVLLALGLPLAGCATGQFALNPRAPKGVDPEVVEQLVCVGKADEASRYVELRGGSQADRIEAVERARRAVSGKPGCCALGKCEGSN